MQIFNCRSPFIVEVNGAVDQIATRVEIFICDVTGVTLLKDYNLIKTMFSPTQRINYYNISPFCYDILIGNYQGDNCIKVFTSTYYTDDSNVEHLIDDFEYYVTLGFSIYAGEPNTGDTILNNYIFYRPNQNYYTNLIKTEKINYFKNTNWDSEGYPNIQFLLETITYKFRLRYYVYSEGEIIEQFENLPITGNVDYYGRVMNNGYSAFNNGNFFEIQVSLIAGTESWTEIFKAELTPICEPKYKPLRLQFLNRYGGTQDFYFFKNNNQSIEVKSSNYNTNTFYTYPTQPNTLVGQTRVYNKNGKHTLKGNTGWISEDYNEFIEDIMLSEWLYLSYEDKGTIWTSAVTLKDTSMQYKTHLNEKVINYELSFEVANSIINNVI
jgi:hypothetical protein